MDWNTFSLSALYTDFKDSFKNALLDVAKGNDPARTTVTNPPTWMIRWNSTGGKPEIYGGSSWGDLASTYNINVSHLGGNAAALYAPLASPTFTGTPAAPTASTGTNNAQLATTSYVVNRIANDAPTKTGSGASGTWGISISGNAASVSGFSGTHSGTSSGTNTGDQTITLSGDASGSGTGSITVTVSSSTVVKIAGAQDLTGRKVFVAGAHGNNDVNTATGGLGEMEVRGNGTGAAVQAFHRPGSFAAYFGLNIANKWVVGGWSMGPVMYEVYHQGNPPPSNAPSESSEQDIQLASLITVAHGLGAKPKEFWAVMICKTAEFGYSVGDEVPAQTHNNTGPILGVMADATNVRFVVSGQGMMVVRRDTWAVDSVAHGGSPDKVTNWKLILRWRA